MTIDDVIASRKRLERDTMKNLKSARSILAYPLCNGRGVLLTMAAGTHGGPTCSQFRVDFNKLLASFSMAERAAWYRQSVNVPADEHGIHE